MRTMRYSAVRKGEYTDIDKALLAYMSSRVLSGSDINVSMSPMRNNVEKCIL